MSRHHVGMAGPTRTPEYDSATIRRIAVEASADPRTVVRRLLKMQVAGVCAQRIDAALERLGLGKDTEDKAA